MDALFDRVREEASRSAWSRGVELARAGAVYGERRDGAELTVRVRPSGGLIHPTVILYPADAEWECDCPGGEDPCEHVAAAAIALRRARREGQDVPESTPDAGGRLAYRLRSEPEGLVLERIVLRDGEETPLRTTLVSVASGRVAGPPVSPTQADLAVERALGPRLAGPLPRGVVRALLGPLQACEDVQLDDEPISTSPEPVGVVARLADDPRGFRIYVERDPPVDREVAGGFALCGGVLRELGPTRLDGREREALQAGWVFAPDDVPRLLGEVLPALEARMPVAIDTERLPRTTREPPRLRIETQRRGDRLSVLATVVYGDPPRARIDSGRLVHLGGAVPLRDEAAEERLVRQLRRALGLTPGRREELDAEAAIQWVARLDSVDASLVGEGHRDFFGAPRLEPRLELHGDGFELGFAPASKGGAAAARRLPTETVLHAWRHGRSLVALVGGGFAPLPAEWLERHGRRVADLLAARRPSGELPPSALPDLARLCRALDQPPPPGLQGLTRLLEGFEGLPAAELPGDLTAKLRPYQRRGVDFLAFHRSAGLGALLADDMGLGKTLQALCVLRTPALVVAPTSLLGNWRDEIERFRPALRARIYHGSERALDPDADVTLTSYALLRRDREALAEVPWASVVLDEAQTIKNPESQVAQAAFSLQAQHRVALTGTPVENRLQELWSQLHFLNPGLLGGRRDFEERYARPIARGEEAVAAHLRERVGPFVLRRRKRDVAPELPPRIEQVLHCSLSDEERAVYDAVRASTREELVRRLGAGGNVVAALEALLRLRQACCHPGLVPGQTLERSAKLELLVDRLETAAAEGHKALVFSQWTSLLDRAEPFLRTAGLPFLRLDGSTRDREGVVARFQSDDGPPVFLISLRAGGTGLNLTAADHVFLLDPWWNPAVEEQAADRAHRIGQERPVIVYRMVAENTVEERILALQEQKRGLSEAALAGAGGGLSRDDLLALLDDAPGGDGALR